MPTLKPAISTSRLVKQYLRWLPAQIGLINKGAFLLQINDILPDDIFLVSYPKSGNTWLRFILAYLINGTQKSLNLQGIESIVPDVYRSKDVVDAMHGRRIIKTHDALFEYYPKVVYIYRDYRDVLVSYYHYKAALKEFEGTFSAFIRSDEIAEPFGAWKQHVKLALQHAAQNPNKILLLKYEDLLGNFETELEKLAVFCKIEQWNVDEIKRLTEIATLKNNETTGNSDFLQRSGSRFFREGKAGKWEGYILKEDLDYLYSDIELVELMKKLGYQIA